VKGKEPPGKHGEAAGPSDPQAAAPKDLRRAEGRVRNRNYWHMQFLPCRHRCVKPLEGYYAEIVNAGFNPRDYQAGDQLPVSEYCPVCRAESIVRLLQKFLPHSSW